MMWRSKLGTDYDKAMIERNDARTKAELDRLRLLPENRFCADCGKRGTVWASVNLGVFLCLKCGSHHRSIGTHISKPKGCTGTYLWGPDEIAQMQKIGNQRAADLYGGAAAEERPGHNASDATWRQFLIAKYEHKRFAPPPKLQEAPEMDFFSHTETLPHPAAVRTTSKPSFGGFGTGSPTTVAKDSIALAQEDLLSFIGPTRRATTAKKAPDQPLLVFHDASASSATGWASFPESHGGSKNTAQSPDFFAEFGL